MKFFYNSLALLNLPLFGIQIPLTDERVHKICELINSKGLNINEDFTELKIEREDLERVHTKEYVGKLFGDKEAIQKTVSDTFELINENGEYHRYNPKDANYSLEELVQKVILQTKGTIATAQEALKSGKSFYLGGGYHHAMSFAGRGFCLINDIVIAARWLQKHHQSKLIWIIDVDAHKGDGTAELTQNDPTIRTLSIHMQEGWPLDSGKFDKNGNLNPWFIESDVEIGVAQNEQHLYMDKLKSGLGQLESLDKMKPDLAIIVQGSDPYEKDQLPSSALLSLTREQMLERDLLVYNFLNEKKIPQAYVMSGGYGEYSFEIYCQFLENIL